MGCFLWFHFLNSGCRGPAALRGTALTKPLSLRKAQKPQFFPLGPTSLQASLSCHWAAVWPKGENLHLVWTGESLYLFALGMNVLALNHEKQEELSIGLAVGGHDPLRHGELS